MTAVKTFVIGVLVGTVLGATLLGTISHLLIIALAFFGAGALALTRRRRRLERPSRRALEATPEPEA